MNAKSGLVPLFFAHFSAFLSFLKSLIYRELQLLNNQKRKEKRMTKLITALKITGEIIFIVLGGIELTETIGKLKNQNKQPT